MGDSFNHTQIQQIKLAIEEVMDEVLEEKLQPLKQDVDKVLKIVSDDRQEIPLIEAKVDKHEDQIIELQAFTGLATA